MGFLHVLFEPEMVDLFAGVQVWLTNMEGLGRPHVSTTMFVGWRVMIASKANREDGQFDECRSVSLLSSLNQLDVYLSICFVPTEGSRR